MVGRRKKLIDKDGNISKEKLEEVHRQLDAVEAISQTLLEARHPHVRAVKLSDGENIPTDLLTKKPVAIICTPDQIVLWYIEDGNLKRIH